MRPEDRSDQLDRRMLALPQAALKKSRWLFALLGLLIAYVVIISTVGFVILVRSIEDTRDAVTVQIPGLQAQIEARERTIQDLEIVQGQAIDAIVKMQDQIKELGGEPPRVILRAPPRK